MSEKSPEDIEHAALDLRANHDVRVATLEKKNTTVKYHSDMAKYHDANSDAMPSSVDMEAHGENRDRHLSKLGTAVLNQGLAERNLVSATQDAERHYKENAAEYHDLAVAEAALDGVEINVSQTQEAPERIDVKVNQ